jgi:hypothetical protein
MAAATAPPGAEAVDAAMLDFALYRYKLSLPAAIAAVVIFLFLSLLHLWRLYRHRAFYFTAFTVGGFCMLNHP